MARISERTCPTPLPAHPLRVFTVTGARPGPTLALIGAVHGDELEGPLTLAALLAGFDPQGLAGRLIVCPVANPQAVAAGTRCSPADGLNLARCFPGDPAGSYTQVLAHLIATHVIRPADALIDLHSGGTALAAVPFAGWTEAPGAQGRTARALAEAFGAPFLWRHAGPPAPGRTLSVAHAAGIPAIYVEATGGPFPGPEVLQLYGDGVARVLAHLGMTAAPAPPAPPPPPRRVTGAGDLDHAIAAPVSGLCTAHVAPGDAVRAGTPCFTLTDPAGAVLARVAAPVPGVAMFLRRARRVEAGELLMALATPDDAAPG